MSGIGTFQPIQAHFALELRNVHSTYARSHNASRTEVYNITRVDSPGGCVQRRLSPLSAMPSCVTMAFSEKAGSCCPPSILPDGADNLIGALRYDLVAFGGSECDVLLAVGFTCPSHLQPQSISQPSSAPSPAHPSLPPAWLLYDLSAF